jgi:putative membrane protein
LFGADAGRVDSKGEERWEILPCNAGARELLLIFVKQKLAAHAASPGGKMKTVTGTMCCAVLGFSAVMMQAKAADDNDKKFLAMAAQGDQNEIVLGKLAAQKATNPDVKAFGEKMVKDHTQLSASMKPFVQEWGLTISNGPDADTQKVWDKLFALSGKDFDKEYMKEMVDDHTKDLEEFTTEVKDTKDTKFRAAVIKGKSVVAAHKNMAYDLEKKL